MVISNSGASVTSSIASGVTTVGVDPFEKDPVKRGQQTRLLQKLYHACNCKQDAHSCSEDRHCFAGRKLFAHMSQCTVGSECPVPACRKARRCWKHYRKCEAPDCWLCTQVPTRYESKHKKTPSFDNTTMAVGEEFESMRNNGTSPTSVMDEAKSARDTKSHVPPLPPKMPEMPSSSEQREDSTVPSRRENKKSPASTPTKPTESRTSRMAHLRMRNKGLGLPPRSPMKTLDWAMATES